MQTIPTLDLAVRLRLAITRTSRRLRQEAGTGLSPSLTAALATVDVHGPLTPSELAKRERVQRPTATRLVARLEELGVLQRAADPQDRRSSLLSVTPARRAARPGGARSSRSSASARPPTWPTASRASSPRSAPPSTARPRSSSACWRTIAR